MTVRKAVYWSAIAITVVTGVAGVASMWWTFGVQTYAGVALGRLHVTSIGQLFSLSSPEWVAFANDDIPWSWRLEAAAAWPDTVGGCMSVPLWIPFVITLTVALVSRPRRYPLGYCVRCGYDLTGNVSGVCPECGTTTRA
jgi:hypothetical protein